MSLFSASVQERRSPPRFLLKIIRDMKGRGMKKVSLRSALAGVIGVTVGLATALPMLPGVPNADAAGRFGSMEPVRPSALIRERGRPRVLPALALWAGMLVCVLERWTHQAGLWRLLSDGHLWSYPAFPVTDQAVYHRLERDGIAPLHQLWEQVTQALPERLAPYADRTRASFATEVMALDQVKMDPLARCLPYAACQRETTGCCREPWAHSSTCAASSGMPWSTRRPPEREGRRPWPGRSPAGRKPLARRSGLLWLRLVRLAHRPPVWLGQPARLLARLAWTLLTE